MHVFAVYLIPILIAVLVQAVKRRQREREVDRSMDDWAQALGMVRVGDELVGRIDDVPVGARLAYHDKERWHATWTLYARLQPPLDLGMLVHNRGMEVELPGVGQLEARYSEGDFDTYYRIAGDDPRRLRQLMSPAVTRLIRQRVHPSARLLINDDGVAVQGHRERGTEDWLRRGVAATVATAKAINASRDRVNAAHRFQELEPAWSAFAQRNGLHMLRAPLCIFGTIDDATIYAYANRLGIDRYCLEVFLRFERPLGLGLLVQPMRTVDRMKDVFGARDHKLGDPHFDGTFLVVVSDAAGVESLLDDELRQTILRLHGTVGPFSLTDDGCSFRLPHVPADPAAVPQVVKHLIAIADQVADRRFGAQRGPYR